MALLPLDTLEIQGYQIADFFSLILIFHVRIPFPNQLSSGLWPKLSRTGRRVYCAQLRGDFSGSTPHIAFEHLLEAPSPHGSPEAV